MSWINYQDVIGQLIDAGLEIDGGLEIDTHRPTRCREMGGDRERRGWYWLNSKEIDGASYITGAFGIYRGADNGKRSVKITRDGRAVKISAEDRAAMAARQRANLARMKAMREAEAMRAAGVAGNAWRQYVPEGTSDYLTRKGVGAHGVRFAPAGNGTFAIPMMDGSGKIHGLQVIRGKARAPGKLEKEYWPKGLMKSGHYHLIGGMPTHLILIAEGYATAASLYQATHFPVAVAFDAGNLMPVAASIRKTYRRARILICGDDDYRTEGNPGQAAAVNAAHAIDGAACWPIFAEPRPADRKGPTDFNDLARLEGEAIVRAQVEARIRSLGWPLEAAPAADIASLGSGAVGERPPAMSIMPVDDLVQRFIPIDDGTGKCVWDTWTRKIASRDQMITLLPAGSRAEEIKRHPVYLNRGAAYIDQIGFDPSGADANVKLNTWRGWPIQPVKGSCDHILALLHYLCSEDPDADNLFRWVLCWMAYPLQHPGAKMNSAILMHGPQGTGKSTVWQCLSKIYGDYATVLNQRGIEDRFNSDWADSKLFILAEEVINRAEMWHIKNELKDLITGDWIRINPKNVSAYRQRNQINGVFCSNENQPMVLDNDDRRHCVIYTPPPCANDEYDAVHAEINNGGIAAFYYHLLHLDLGDFHPKKRPPFTKAKAALIALSAPSETRFMIEWGTGELGMPICPARSSDVYAFYLKWCRANGESRPRPSNHFFGAVQRQTGWSRAQVKTYPGGDLHKDLKTTRMIFPPEASIEARFRYDGSVNLAVWYTRCAEAFKESETLAMIRAVTS